MDYLEESATPHDKEELAALYVRSLKESLTTINRFNPENLTQQFLEYYDDFCFIKILIKKEIVGLYSTKDMPDHIWLVHLYVDPKYQSMGIGTNILNNIIREAKAKMLPVRLTTIEKSPANNFYIKNGFTLDYAEDTNNHYIYKDL
ncbi:GNAT family N-acetyltransferase [Hahella aquimaris]|uniref:GNAT family N-acetyltransferase n=1 Tax=Hahella sp. HNIBRBA332 TaxID=3015983 RepID=UPI00273CE4B6|nr:GNAT family N-acetyltransferase [Hahella sp. HNIBRBA332]WLQ11322.1 GNAT family N-acetyltransferase [Hahella sp. HNIBRBA332]